MIEDFINDEQFHRKFPALAALGLIVLFVSLGRWQLDRAAEKNRLEAVFKNNALFTRVTGDMPVTAFQNIKADGHYLPERQVLIDNGRIGYYAFTAFRYAAKEPLLVVNRGWIGRPSANEPQPDIGVSGTHRTIRGRVGFLPRVAIRAGEAFGDAGGWPKTADFPTVDELSAEIGEDLLPFILLLGPDADDGYVRRWQPRESGSMMHYGYAFQWIAMATAVIGIFIWRMRKKPA